MNKIKVELLDYTSPNKLVQLSCLVTRGANKFSSPSDLLDKIENNPWTDKQIIEMLSLPHSKLSRFLDYTFIITGTSRRFLAQLTTHHIGISIMSGSLQYSNHANASLDDKFTIPYEILSADDMSKDYFLNACDAAMTDYSALVKSFGFKNDTAGYCAPEALRNILLVKVNLEELRYIANQRLCNRNTDETSYVVGLMVEQVIKTCSLPDKWFMPSCANDKCKESKFSCGKPVTEKTITELLDNRFSKIRNR